MIVVVGLNKFYTHKELNTDFLLNKLFPQGSHQVSVIGEDIFFLEFSLVEDFFCGAFIVLLGSFSCYEFVMH